jgi:pantoate--beta-alanine ligase
MVFTVRTAKRSLQENDLTVVSIFVNPAQFAPHEDLSSYPRTLARDLELLEALRVSIPHASADSQSPPITRTPSAVFLPSVPEMYPSGISQDRNSQRGTFVEVKKYGDEMEGKNKRGFFTGVATVVTKLFNVIQVRSSMPHPPCIY